MTDITLEDIFKGHYTYYYLIYIALMDKNILDKLPDIRDGLTRNQRIILYCLDQLQKERNGRNVPSLMLYGRVVEYLNISVNEFQSEISVFADRIQS